MEDNKILSNHLVVCDCDGTLLKASVGVPPVNTEAICAFNEAGGKFTIATGRTLPAVQRYLHQMGSFSAPVILCGGALIYDFENVCGTYNGWIKWYENEDANKYVLKCQMAYEQKFKDKEAKYDYEFEFLKH